MNRFFCLLVLLLFVLCACSDRSTSLSQSSAPESNQAGEAVPDLNAATARYLDPLVSGGDVWFYSWDSPSDIRADDFIAMCAVHNYLDLPRDFEGVYPTQCRNPPASDVEDALSERFDITSDHLRTSQYYNAQNGTYELITGGNSGWSTLATGIEERDDMLVISVAQECPLPDDSVPEAAVKMDNKWVIPLCVLTVQKQSGGEPFKYVSYTFTGENAK